MAKISHTKIKQPSFGEKRPKLTYTKISSDTTFLLLLTRYFDVVLKTKSITDKLWYLLKLGI
jgi:hypothetical protein